ncbi:MAG: hypothetical protein EZS28_040428 [Streblomastix strix]|uniref:Uncharacterized protein n=1 Tax=Streblomastix strix TaxID=222440 RepID=A0A5J4U329_9EUKA|nr:MAG: hypothetical protein EZS28_040428 [Streblomastix strix]
MAQATDPLIMNADPAQSNINVYDQKGNERLNADILDQPNTVQNRSQKSSNQRKKRKKKKGHGAQGDSAIADLTGGQGEDNSSMRILIMGFVLITHFICIVGLILGAVIYSLKAQSYIQRLQNLYSVCDLAQNEVQIGTFALETLYLDLTYNFNFSGIGDGQTKPFPFWEELQGKMTNKSKAIIDNISKIYDKTTVMVPWEQTDIDTYVFEIIHTNTTSQGPVKRDPRMLAQDKLRTNLMRVLINLAQKSSQLGNMTTNNPRQDSPTFYNDIVYMIFNSMQIGVQSCKRAMVSYWQEMVHQKKEILATILMIINLKRKNICNATIT